MLEGVLGTSGGVEYPGSSGVLGGTGAFVCPDWLKGNSVVGAYQPLLATKLRT